MLDQLLADRQTEAGAALLAAVGRIGLGELLEYPFTEFVGNAWAPVSDADPHVAVTHAGRQFDLLAGRRKLRGVRQQVAQHLLQAHGVDFHLHRRAVAQAQLHAMAFGVAAIAAQGQLQLRQ